MKPHRGVLILILGILMLPLFLLLAWLMGWVHPNGIPVGP